MHVGTPVADLVQAATRGDSEAWAAIVERYASLVWATCRRFRLAEADQHDVSQTVWLRLVEHLPTLRNSEALPGWLVTTTRRECLDLKKYENRYVQAGLPADDILPDPGADEEVDALLLRAERQVALRHAVRQLPEQCRRLVTLLTNDPPTPYGEISELIGIPVGSIGPTRARCLARLRRAPALAALHTPPPPDPPPPGPPRAGARTDDPTDADNA